MALLCVLEEFIAWLLHAELTGKKRVFSGARALH